MLPRLKDGLLVALLFFLPWQTRLIYREGMLQGRFWEYGTLAIYATEFLLWAAVLIMVWERGRVLSWTILRERFKKNRIRLMVGSLVFVFIAGQSFSHPEAEVAAQQLVFIIGAVCLAFLIITSAWRWEILAAAFWSSAIIQSLIGLYQFFGQYIGANKWFGLAYQSAGELGSSVIELSNERWLRAYGSFGSPNGLGIYLAVAFIVGLLLYEKVATKFRPLVTFGQLFIIAGLTVSFSRGAWLAALAGLVIIGVGSIRRKSFSLFSKQIAGAVGVVLVFVFALWSLFSVRLTSDARLEVRSVQERSSQYHEAIKIFRKTPFFGVGLKNYTFVANQSGQLPLRQPVHNVYLLVLTELGIVGLIWLAWLARCIKYYLLSTMLPLIAALAVAGLFDHYLWSFYSGFMLVGLVVGLAIKRRG